MKTSSAGERASWNIALDATYSVGDNLSGVGVYSREISAGLARAHPESRFLYCYRPHRLLRSFSQPLPRNARRRLLWNRAGGSADVFHGLNQRLDRRYRRAIATFHDLFVLTGEYSTPEFRARFADQARIAAERADLVIAVSEFTARQVENLLGVDRGRIRVIPHGVRTAVPQSVERQPIILFVGAIQKRKNVSRLVKAFELVPAGWKLFLVGSAGYGAETELAAVEQSRRRADITVTGYVDNAELEMLYSRASVFAFPSLDEGFGIPVLEAMARGLPVLTANVSALPEVAGDGALLVDPKDVESIAAGLCRLIEDAGLRDELSHRGLQRSRRYTWDAAADATWRVYSELMS